MNFDKVDFQLLLTDKHLLQDMQEEFIGIEIYKIKRHFCQNERISRNLRKKFIEFLEFELCCGDQVEILLNLTGQLPFGAFGGYYSETYHLKYGLVWKSPDTYLMDWTLNYDKNAFKLWNNEELNKRDVLDVYSTVLTNEEIMVVLNNSGITRHSKIKLESLFIDPYI